MSDFLRELEEDLHDERIINFWRNYGNYLIGLALALVIGTAGYTFWKYLNQKWQTQAYESFSNAVRLVRVGKKDEALKIFQDLGDGKGGYAKLSRLYEGALLSDPKDLYMKMSKENVSDPALGNLPKVLLAARNVDNDENLAPLESLTAPNNAWAPLSLELLALASLKKGDQAKAAEGYLRIVDEGSSTLSERVRAGLMLSQIDVPAHLLEPQKQKETAQ